MNTQKDFDKYNASYYNYCNTITSGFQTNNKLNLNDNRCFCVLKDQKLKNQENYNKALDTYFKKMLNTDPGTVEQITTSLFCVDNNCFNNNPIMEKQLISECPNDAVICDTVVQVVDSDDININIKSKCGLNCIGCTKGEICNKDDLVCYRKCNTDNLSPCKINEDVYYACVKDDDTQQGMCKNCTSNKDCQNGFKCDKGLCKRICENDSSCKDNKKCFYGICKECVDNKDCKKGICSENGVCVDCVSNKDCEDGKQCFAGLCRECVDDTNCPLGQECKNNKCVSITPQPEEPESVEVKEKNKNLKFILGGLTILFVILLIINIIK